MVLQVVKRRASDVWQRLVTGQFQGHINVDVNNIIWSYPRGRQQISSDPFVMQQNLITSGKQGGVYITVMVFLTTFLVSNKVVPSYLITRLQTRLQFFNKIISIYIVRGLSGIVLECWVSGRITARAA